MPQRDLLTASGPPRRYSRRQTAACVYTAQQPGTGIRFASPDRFPALFCQSPGPHSAGQHHFDRAGDHVGPSSSHRPAQRGRELLRGGFSSTCGGGHCSRWLHRRRCARRHDWMPVAELVPGDIIRSCRGTAGAAGTPVSWTARTCTCASPRLTRRVFARDKAAGDLSAENTHGRQRTASFGRPANRNRHRRHRAHRQDTASRHRQRLSKRRGDEFGSAFAVGMMITRVMMLPGAFVCWVNIVLDRPLLESSCFSVALRGDDAGDDCP